MIEATLAEEIVEAFGIDRTEPGGAFLEELFVRFQREVPYQRTEGAESAELVLSRFLEKGSGVDGDTRTGVFLALAAAFGLEVATAEGISPGGQTHALGVAVFDGRELLVDASFPLPCLLPLRHSGAPLRTGFGDLRVEGTGGDRAIVLEARERSQTLFRLRPGSSTPPSPEAPGTAREWGLPEGTLFRLEDDRLCRWRAGTFEVLDRWSRLRVPLSGRETALLEALFRQPVQGLDEVPASPAPPTLDAAP